MPSYPPPGYYEVPGLPYPRTPSGTNRNRDLLGNVVDPAMEPDLGARTSDVATQTAAQRLGLPPNMVSGAPAPAQQAPTVLQPSRTSPYSSRDAQALATLDPRALAEAEERIALDKPSKMTATFGGKSYEMTPAPRVNREVLGQIYNKYLNKQGQEREDAVRSQEQAGKERIVTIPGEQATAREKMRLESQERVGTAERMAGEAERSARVGKIQAETAAALAESKRAERQPDMERRAAEQAAVDEALARAESSPFAQTPSGRAAIAALRRRSTVGQLVPETASVQAPEMTGAETAANLAADPAISRLIEAAKTQSGSRAVAARNLIRRAIEDAAQKRGFMASEVLPYIYAEIDAR